MFGGGVKLLAGIVFTILMLLGHCVMESLIVAPITAIAVLLSVSLMKYPKGINAILEFLGMHSTNIWLVHMFFYLPVFGGLVFKAKYPVVIISLMFVMCIIVSHIIRYIYDWGLRIMSFVICEKGYSSAID